MTTENLTIPRLSGDLTFEKWAEWNSNELQKSMKNVTDQNHSVLDLIYSQLHNYYDCMKDSEWLLANFLSLPKGLQNVTMETLKYPIQIETVESFIKLALDFSASNASITYEDTDHRMFNMSVLESCGNPSRRLRQAVEDFRDIHHKEHVIIKGLVVSNSAFMLADMFGEDKFIEMIALWSQSNTEPDLGSFVNVMKRWDEVSEYPLAWAIRLVKD